MTEPIVIVDLETTGTSAAYGRILEVGVVRVEDGNIVDTFESLINPECYIHPAIEQLTGIRQRDVLGAPVFSEVSRDLARLLAGAVFVAHNASFDYGFLRHEFSRVGRDFRARCLCTMRLSRRLYPEHRRHDLSSIIERYGLACPARHRALGDALAVFAFLNHIRSHVGQERFTEAVRQVVKDDRLPPHIERATVQQLPDTCGVYLLYGASDELLYVGKSKTIRTRVLSHFSGDDRSSKEIEMCRSVARIEVRATPGELGALLLESALIKELHPIYNSVARSTRKMILARGRLTRTGYHAVALEEVEHIAAERSADILAVFKSRKQAERFLRDAARDHGLCHALLGLERPRGSCFGYHLHQCHGACVGEEPPDLYNQRVERAFAKRRVKAWPFKGPVMIQDQDPVSGEAELFVLDNWCLVGTARSSDGGSSLQRQAVHRFDYDTYKILLRYLSHPAHRARLRPAGQAIVGAEPAFAWDT